MKGKVIRRILSMALIAAMVVTVPVGAYEEESAEEVSLQEESSEEFFVEETTDTVDGSYDDDDPEEIPYTFGKKVSSTMEKGDIDVYSFTVQKAGRVSIHTESGGNYWIIGTEFVSLEDLDDCKLWQFPTDETTHIGVDDNHVDLIPGTYYLYVISGSYGAPDEIEYSFTLKMDEIKAAGNEKTAFDDSIEGSHKNANTAWAIVTDQKYVAQSHNTFLRTGGSPSTDWFMFTLKKDSRVYLSASTDQIDLLKFRFYTYDSSRRIEDLISTDPCPIEVYANQQITNQQVKKYREDTVLKAGTYCMNVVKERDDSNDSKGNTGAYRFIISTKQTGETDVPVTGVTIQNNGAAVNSIRVSLDDTKELTAVVKPDKATEKGVTWESDNPDVAQVSNDGVVTGVAVGECTIIATTIGVTKNDEHLTAECKVKVVQASEQKETPIVIAKQKYDLSGEDFFNEPFDSKNEKYVWAPKNLAGISKDKFTAKKPGIVTVTKQVKEGKKYADWRSIEIEIETPVVQYPAGEKTFKKFVPEQEIDLDELIICEKSGAKPARYVAGDKSGKKYALTSDGRKLNIYQSGNVKVTAYYSEGNEASYPINFTVKIPKLNKTKVSIKETKNAQISISNVQKGKTPTWFLGEYDEDEDAYVEIESDHVRYEVVNGSNGLKCKVFGLEQTDPDAPVMLVAEVDGYQYSCAVTVK